MRSKTRSTVCLTNLPVEWKCSNDGRRWPGATMEASSVTPGPPGPVSIG
jgi:hypothetical protein